MQVVNKKLLAVLAALMLALVGCDSGGGSTPVGGGTGGSGGTGGDADAVTTPDADDDAQPPDDNGPQPETTEDVQDEPPPVEDTCDCGTRECGTAASGCSCGVCDAGYYCTADGQCELEDTQPNGAWCGTTADCPFYVPDPANPGEEIYNEDYGNCLHDQCSSKFCASAGAQGVFVLHPVCSRPCDIVKDDVNNATGAPGADGVEDADTPLTDCGGFDDGPAGTSYYCVNFAPPNFGQTLSYCMPTISGAFKQCVSAADCAEGEGCFLGTIGGDITSRCMTKISEGEWGTVSGLGGNCNETDPFEGDGLEYCAEGICFGLGCVTWCGANSDCDTTVDDPSASCSGGTCTNWAGQACAEDVDCSAWTCNMEGQQIFSNVPEYTPTLCWPRTCEFDADCTDGYYCRFFWNGLAYPDAGWDNMCLKQVEDGAALGEECDMDPGDNIPGPTCASEDMCVGGFCSGLCREDADCATGQLCTVVEFPGDFDEDDEYDFTLILNWCEMFEGAGADCLSEVTCGDGETCQWYETENLIEDPDNPGEMILHPDGPYKLNGKCMPAETSGEWGAPCYGAEDCTSGICLGADAAANIPGFCTMMCEAAADCPDLQMTDETGNPVTMTARCTSLLLGWGGDLNDYEVFIYVGLCQPNPSASSGADCAGTMTCDETSEACFPSVVTYGPDYVPTVDYICQDLTNADGSMPTKTVGEECDPSAEDAEGNYVEQCLSGLCLEDAATGMGFCSALCDPTADTCAADSGDETMACMKFNIYPRRGEYLVNAGGFDVCRKDVDCTPCFSHSHCPGDRRCVNLGQDADTLSDFRCVPACTTSDECAGQTATTCSEGVDAIGNPVMGCFETGADFPVNFCNEP